MEIKPIPIDLSKKLKEHVETIEYLKVLVHKTIGIPEKYSS